MLYRSCGDCDQQYTRHVQMNCVRVNNGHEMIAINQNYGDTVGDVREFRSRVSSQQDRNEREGGGGGAETPPPKMPKVEKFFHMGSPC